MENHQQVNGRERVLAALAHREPDRVPIDLGSTYVTTIAVRKYEELKQHLGIEAETQIMDRMQQVCVVDERVLQHFEIDTRGVFVGPPELESNQSVELGENKYRDAWGTTWHRPPSSYYYDLLKPPLAGEISTNDIIRHKWPNPEDPGYTRGLRDRVRAQRDSTDCALVLNLSVWVVHCSQFVRGFEDWFVDLVAQPRLMTVLLDAITESLLGVIERVLDEVGDLVDVIAVADDLGHQDRPCMRPEMYRRLVKPRHSRLMESIKARADAPVMWHTCGSVYELLDDLIGIGVNALNPVQTNAANMEPERLKRQYGDRLAFWGTIDTSRALPFGTPLDVEEEVQSKISVFAPGGGYILSPVHNIQPNVPLENVLAMFNAAWKHGRYSVQAGL
jgi:uroporphyrinogen decarboxylase